LSRGPRPDRRLKWLLPGDGAIDELNVHRAARGIPVRLTRDERTAAARLIIQDGGGPSLLSLRLHMSGTTAGRLYERLAGRPPGPAGNRLPGPGGGMSAQQGSAGPGFLPIGQLLDLDDRNGAPCRGAFDRVAEMRKRYCGVQEVPPRAVAAVRRLRPQHDHADRRDPAALDLRGPRARLGSRAGPAAAVVRRG